jgi:DNA replication protein DnaC
VPDDEHDDDREDPVIEPRPATEHPMPIAGLLKDLLAEAEQNFKAAGHPEIAEAMLIERAREIRAARIAPYRRFITAEDYRRIVRDELDKPPGEVVRRFVAARDDRKKTRARVLWLAGTTGVGKTVAALSAIAAYGGTAVTADDVRRAYGQEHGEARELQYLLERAGLLVVDDVGTARDVSEEKRAILALVNARQGAPLQTILTGNLSVKAVREYDARLVSRLEHIGMIFDCGTKSLRRAPARTA